MLLFNKIVNSISESLEFNKNTFSGCIDIIVIRNEEKELKSSPFHVKFGTFKLFKSKQKEVKILINDELVQDVVMKVGPSGDTYFLEKVMNRKRLSRKSSSIADNEILNKELDQSDRNKVMSNIQDQDDNISVKSSKSAKLNSRKRLKSVDRYNIEPNPTNNNTWKWFWKNQDQQQIGSKEDQEINQMINDILESNQNKSHSFMSSLFKIFRSHSKSDQAVEKHLSNDEIQDHEQKENQVEEMQDEPQLEMSLCGDVDIDQITPDYFNEKKVQKEQYDLNYQSILASKDLVVKVGDKMYNWQLALPHIISLLVFKQPIENYSLEHSKNQPEHLEQIEQNEEQNQIEEFNQNEVENDSESITQQSMSQKKQSIDSGKFRNKKTLQPRSETLQKLGLKPGYNKITFQVKSTLMGKQQIEGAIYLWDCQQKIVISDIDGTITKSDVLGQLYPLVNKSYCHNCITDLLTNIYRNNYKIIYLTARAIGQYEQTRSFLHNVSQNQQFLPPGPIIMSPDGLVRSFKREVIYKKPELFKIAALREIKQLFPIQQPFYAGFGNRDTDALAYKAVGISINKIFLVNTIGQVHGINNTYVKTYEEINHMVDQMFPFFDPNKEEVLENYSSNQFWQNNFYLQDEVVQLDDYY